MNKTVDKNLVSDTKRAKNEYIEVQEKEKAERNELEGKVYNDIVGPNSEISEEDRLKKQLLKPKIELVGTKGDKDWYTTDITVKIVDRETDSQKSKAAKIKYSVTGDNPISEQIKDGRSTEFTITKDGISIITAYVLDSEGNESVPIKVDVKKDATPPTLDLKQEDTQKKEYGKTISITASDATTSVILKKYKNKSRSISYFRTNGEVVNGNSVMIKTDDSFENVTSGNEPYYTYSFYVKDEAGNETVKSMVIENLLIDVKLSGKKGLAVTAGCSINPDTGAVTVGPGGTQYGPYWRLTKGTYTVTYEGDNLQTVASAYQFRSIYDPDGPEDYKIVLKSASPTEVVYEVEVTRDTSSLELMYYGKTNETSTIYNIRVMQNNI